MKIFFTSFLQIFLVAVNTILLTKGFVVGIFFTSFTISLLWCFNISKISVSTKQAKLVYSLGAGFGAVCGYYVVNFLT